MKKWLYKIFLGNLKFKERGWIDIPLWIVYLFSTILLFNHPIGTLFLLFSVPGIIRMLLTVVYTIYKMIIYLIPGKWAWNVITSPFSMWLETKYQWMYRDPK
jgi:hypothetical protein